MDNTGLIKEYFKKFFTGKARHSQVREYLTDDFQFRGPLMKADSAQDYIEQLQAMGDEFEMYADIRKIICEGDRVAVLVDFRGPAGPMTYAQWFQLRGGRICRLEVVYDPRPFFQEPDPRD